MEISRLGFLEEVAFEPNFKAWEVTSLGEKPGEQSYRTKVKAKCEDVGIGEGCL